MSDSYHAYVEYDDGSAEREWFDDLAKAEAWVREECAWEGTRHGVVKGPGYECFFPGDFS